MIEIFPLNHACPVLVPNLSRNAFGGIVLDNSSCVAFWSGGSVLNQAVGCVVTSSADFAGNGKLINSMIGSCGLADSEYRKLWQHLGFYGCL